MKLILIDKKQDSHFTWKPGILQFRPENLEFEKLKEKKKQEF